MKGALDRRKASPVSSTPHIKLFFLISEFRLQRLRAGLWRLRVFMKQGESMNNILARGRMAVNLTAHATGLSKHTSANKDTFQCSYFHKTPWSGCDPETAQCWLEYRSKVTADTELIPHGKRNQTRAFHVDWAERRDETRRERRESVQSYTELN